MLPCSLHVSSLTRSAPRPDNRSTSTSMSGTSMSRCIRILGRLWFGHSLQQQLRAVALAWVQRDEDAGGTDVGVAPRLGPELGESFGISAVQCEPKCGAGFRLVMVSSSLVIRRCAKRLLSSSHSCRLVATSS